MKNIYVILISVIFLCGCSAIFEKSIKDQSILVYIPADSFKTKLYNQQFYWEKVSGALSYRLQIASPSFNPGIIQRMIVDTIVMTNSIHIILNSGEYEWRIRAQNGGSETEYVTRKLFIDNATFDQRPLNVTSPKTTLITFENNIQFDWLQVIGAENYTIQIDTFNGNFTKSKVTTVDNSQLSAFVTLDSRGKYKWRMFSDSAGIKSLYSSTGYIEFKMDTVGLLTPKVNENDVSQNLDFTWSIPVNKLATDIYTYELFLYNSTFTLIDNYPQTAPQMPIIINSGEAIQLKGLEKGKTYYWSIVAKDQYGLTSQKTTKRKFTVSS